MHRVMTVLPCLLLAIAAAGCHPVEPSPVSEELETVVIPAVVAWSRSGAATLDLRSYMQLGADDKICMMSEYDCLNHLNVYFVNGVMEYHSSFGKCVPENKLALIVIQKGIVHAAVIDRTQTKFDALSQPKCVKATKAVLRRFLPEPGRASLVRLEEQ